MRNDLPDDMKRDVLRSLTRVGQGKAIGYLPIPTIHNVLNLPIETVKADMVQRGLDTLVVEQCCIKGGALYAFDREALQKLLTASSELLEENDWPYDPKEFVQRIASEWLEPAHPIVALIRSAFGDL